MLTVFISLDHFQGLESKQSNQIMDNANDAAKSQ